MDFSRYKACLFDVDKTLTNTKKELTSRTREALSRLSRNGIQIGVCTGRHYATLQPILRQFPEDALHVVAAGTQIIRTDGIVLHHIDFPTSTLDAILTLTSTHAGKVLIPAEDKLYGNPVALSDWILTDPDSVRLYPISDVPRKGIGVIEIDEVTEILLDQLELLSVSIKRLKSYRGTTYAELTPPGVSKGSGINEWCRISGIKPEEIVGFGDSENDLEFLQTVGHAVAMGNASEAVKQIADEVTTDCDHDGVAEWIERQLQAKS